MYAGAQEIRIADDGAVTATRYYQFAGKTVAVRTDRGLGDGVTSLVSDHHGTPVAATTNGGHPVKAGISRLYTDPFGGRRGDSTETTVPGDTQFLGKTRDESTGLTQIGARYYDEKVGSFISVDPLLDLTSPQQWNGYAYANNNPVSLTDPTGLLPAGYSSATFDSMDRAMADRAKSNRAPATVVPPVRIDQFVDDIQCAGMAPGACHVMQSVEQHDPVDWDQAWGGPPRSVQLRSRSRNPARYLGRNRLRNRRRLVVRRVQRSRRGSCARRPG